MRIAILTVTLSAVSGMGPGWTAADEVRASTVCERVKAVSLDSDDFADQARVAIIGSGTEYEIENWIEDSRDPDMLSAIFECAGLVGPTLSPRQTRLVDLLSVSQRLRPYDLEDMSKYNAWSLYFKHSLSDMQSAFALLRQRGHAYPTGYWHGSPESINIAGDILLPYMIEQARICMDWLPHGGDATCRRLQTNSIGSGFRIAAGAIAIRADANCATIATMAGIDVPKLMAELDAWGVSGARGSIKYVWSRMTTPRGVERGSQLWRLLALNYHQFA